MGLSLSVVAFIALFTPGDIYAWLSLPARFALLALALLLFLGWSLLFIPRIVRLGLSKGWPIVGLQIALYIPPVAVMTEVLRIFPAFADQTPPVGQMFAAGMFMTALTCMLGALLFQSTLAPTLSDPITARDLWTFRRPKQDDLQDHLPPEIRAEPIHMQAENQYTRIVTSRGQDLVRMTLSAAEALADPDCGMRIHRSHWVSYAAIDALTSRGGNPRVILTSGADLPVSRQKVAALRAALNARKNA